MLEWVWSLAGGIYSLIVEKGRKGGKEEDKMLEWVCSLAGGIYSLTVDKGRKGRRWYVGMGLFSSRRDLFSESRKGQ